MRFARSTALRLLSIVAVITSVSACTDTMHPPADQVLALGTWGGDNAGVLASDSGTHVHVGCTFGDMPPMIQLDEDGRFTVDGSYVLQAFPIVLGPTLPAQFSGQVTGNILTLAIAVDDTVAHRVVALGPVTVTYGRSPLLGPCPICLAPRRTTEGGTATPMVRTPTQE